MKRGDLSLRTWISPQGESKMTFTKAAIVVVALAIWTAASRAEDNSANARKIAPTRKGNALYAPEPNYPEWARRLGMAGSGVFIVNVRRDGTVESVTVYRSTGYAELDRSSIRAFRKWRFRPGTVSKAKIPITFFIGKETQPTRISIPRQ
jgi:protein TonB